MKNSKIILLIILTIHLESFSQPNPLTNSYSFEHNPISSVKRTFNTHNDYKVLAGIQCDSNSFFALRGDSIDKYTLTGNTAVYNGTILGGAGSSLAICNNLNGNIFSPTFYTSVLSTANPCSFYNGINWTTIPISYSDFLINNGGNDTFLYFMAVPMNSFIRQIVRYDGISISPIYTTPNQGTIIDIADLSVDNSGNVWFITTSDTANFISDSLVIISPSGQLLKQLSFAYNCKNAYGSFLLNNIFYIGLGPNNPVHPNTLIPLTITADSVIIGDSINMPAFYYLDLASCNPGSPLSIDIKNISNIWNLFPNPFQENLSISIQKQYFKQVLITIKDILGQIVFIEEDENLNNNYSKTIDLSFLSNGIYFVELYIEGERTVKKIVKQ
ncbi:MAG: T9SS type A sorting domain-containing protein [Bacteroidia bacterium]